VAVGRVGESSWKAVSDLVKTRTAQQCLHRWMKSLQPSIKKRARWTDLEDQLLRKAFQTYGPAWSLVRLEVPGRTDMQCRERWMNVLNPDVVREGWTPEEVLVIVLVLLKSSDVSVSVILFSIYICFVGRVNPPLRC